MRYLLIPALIFNFIAKPTNCFANAEVYESSKKATSYKFGSPKIVKDESTNKWKATLPGNGFNIISLWTDKPEPSFEVVDKGQIILQHVDDSSLHYLHGLSYIFDPALDPIYSKSKEPLVDAVMKQLILTPTEEAKKSGYEVELQIIDGSKTTMPEVIFDKRFLRLIKKDGKNKDAHFYRIIIGQDFVIVGMIIAAYDANVVEANNFLNQIIFETKKSSI